MYLPDRFRVDDTSRLHEFMERHSFAVMITHGEGETLISHVPVILDRAYGQYGRILAHLAAANPQVRHIESGAQATVLFQGPHAYVSPRWYASPLEVPTWNYTAVYASGRLRALESAEETLKVLRQLAHNNEGEAGWKFDPGAQWIGVMLRQILAFEMPVEKLNGKFKLSQNKGSRDREGVIREFEASGHPDLQELAGLMREMNAG